MSTSPPAYKPETLDLRALMRTGEALSGHVGLAQMVRWKDGAPEWPSSNGEPLALQWQVQVEGRTPAGGREQVWLHLVVTGQVPQVCQRCLSVYLEPVAIDRWFRFVDDEATAEAEDDDAEEDLLVWAPRFNVLDLVEDELLLALPLVPMHSVCPVSLPARSGEGALQEAERPHPFAALSVLKGVPPEKEGGHD